MTTQTTGKTLFNMAVRNVKDQALINEVCTTTFAGKTYVAPEDSALHEFALLAADAAAKVRTMKADAKKKGDLDKVLAQLETRGWCDEKGRFQVANKLATMIGRWLHKQERFTGRRVSISTTGTIRLALVERNDANHKTPRKSKTDKGDAIKNVKDLASLLQYAVDHYGLEAVQKAAAALK